MVRFINLLIIIFLIQTISCSQQNINSDLSESESTTERRVGDMIITPEQMEPQKINEKGLHLKLVQTWPDGIVRYQFDPIISSDKRQLFMKSCVGLGKFAQVQCLPKRTHDPDYIYITTTNENFCGLSNIGRIGGRQNLRIKCWQQRTIQHELMHALGISHEHNRPDRDSYLTINWENISTHLKNDFAKVNHFSVNKMLDVYDFNSIMHYSSYAGSNNGNIVLYQKQKGPQKGQIQQSNHLSYYDHYTLYILYGGEKPR